MSLKDCRLFIMVTVSDSELRTLNSELEYATIYHIISYPGT